MSFYYKTRDRVLKILGWDIGNFLWRCVTPKHEFIIKKIKSKKLGGGLYDRWFAIINFPKKQAIIYYGYPSYSDAKKHLIYWKAKNKHYINAVYWEQAIPYVTARYREPSLKLNIKKKVK